MLVFFGLFKDVESPLKGVGKYLFLLAILQLGTVVAEPLYVNDSLRVGIRANPNSAEIPIAVVTTGEALEVLEEQEGYYKVRSESGVEGWVSMSYVSKEVPAKLRLGKVEKAFARQKDNLVKMRKEAAVLEEQNKGLKSQVTELQSRNSKLEQELGGYKNSDANLIESYRWLLQFFALTGIFLLGVYLGIRQQKQRIAKRLGGLEI